MTVEIVYDLENTAVNDLGRWSLKMAEKVEANRGFPITDISRELTEEEIDGFSVPVLIVSVETTLPNQAVENILSDIEAHLPDTAEHVETREVE